MKFEGNKRYLSISIYAFLVIAASIVTFFLIKDMRGVGEKASKLISLMMPFILGFVIAYILNPLLRRMDTQFVPWLTKGKLKPKTTRMLAVLLTYLIALIVLVAFFSFIIPEIAASIAGIVSMFPLYLQSAERFLADVFGRLQALGVDNAMLQDALDRVFADFEGILRQSYAILEKAMPFVLGATKHIADGVLNVVLGIIISVYLLMSKERFFAQIKKLLYSILPARYVERTLYITHKSHATFGGFINGKLLDSLIIGILCFVGTVFWCPNAMLISVIVGVTNIIPYFGPFIGAIPCALLILLVDPVKTVWFILFILVLQQFDGNILGPKILGESIGLPAFWVIFAIVVFSSLLGVLGMFIGVPLFAVIYTLIREYAETRLQKKGMSANTEDYASDSHKLLF